MSRIISGFVSFLISIVLLLESTPLAWVPTLTVDASKPLGEVTTKATGFLYGLAEPGVPSDTMSDSLDISSVSQKVIDGLQHPTGDINHIYPQLDECDYTVVYLQDAFSTWYYCHREIMDMRAAGTYDWKEYITNVYFPIVEEKVRELMNVPYADKLVYCIYNECDNAIWFGNYVDGNVHYDDIGRANFYEAWEMTYDLVKSIDPDALIGGPGFCDYETTKIRGFMEYCAENDCVPEIMIYHELAYWSIPDWHLHVADYRNIEAECGVDELPIIVTEYGTMEDCGNPTTMLHYIIAMEKSGVYGNMAYWRLANNLNDTAADYNSPNSNWWLYRKYAEMEGQLLEVTSETQGQYNYRERLDGIAALTSDGETITMIVSGSEERQNVKVKSLDETNMGCNVTVTVECMYYQGLTGIVSEPILLNKYKTSPSFGNLNINLPATDTDSVYFVTVTKSEGDVEPVRNTNIPVRYEFEDGTLLGSAYTYDSAYATTGQVAGMVGGIENEGDGVRITVKADKEGLYNFDFIFGNSNDGATNDDRDYTTALFSIDGTEKEILLPNTIKSEYTDCYRMELYLTRGKHTIEFKHGNGTYVLDSVLLSRHENDKEIYVTADGENKYLAVAPQDGYYNVITGTAIEATVDGIDVALDGNTTVYLRRGLNAITLAEDTEISVFETSDTLTSYEITASELVLSDGAALSTDKYGTEFVDGISSEGGKAEFTVSVADSGTYRVTLSYANNQEGGYHDYNVDLIEALLTVEANGNSQDIFCRSTYSRFTYTTVTFSLYLEAGENTVTLSSSGNMLFNNQTSYAPQIESLTINQTY